MTFKQDQTRDVSLMVAFVCNPYLAVLQKKLYLKYWKDEVDEVLVNVNGRNDEIRNFIIDLWQEDDKVKYVDDMPSEIRQGPAFFRLFPLLKGRVMVTMDSDNFIYAKGVIKEFSDLILNDQFDSVGSSGHHARPNELTNLLIKTYGTVRFNPFMSFWNKRVVDRIDNLKFGAFTFKEGEKFYWLPEYNGAGQLDVMGLFSCQFFEKANRKKIIPPSEEGRYVHNGAISSIYRRFFKNLEDNNEMKWKETYMTKQNINYWIWYYLIYQYTYQDVPFDDYNKEYFRGLEFEIKKSGASLEIVLLESDKIIKQHPGLFT